MGLLPKDKEFLDKHGYNYEVHEQPGVTLLVINDYSLSSIFDREKTKVLVRIPTGYPAAQLDMFWVNPTVKLKSTNNCPPQADVFESYFPGESWQRFSRHYQWEVGNDLSTHLNVIREILVNGRS
jgi:hypothetical protein